MNLPHEFQKPSQSLGEWIISVIITKIPLIGLIMLIVWAVDKDTEPNKSNWAKAELIVQLIGIAIFILIFAAVGFSFLTHFGDDFEWSKFE